MERGNFGILPIINIYGIVKYSRTERGSKKEMGKLHELLAVESDLKAAAQRSLSHMRGVFTDGVSRFVGQARKYQPLDETGETFADEVTVLATTVSDELATMRLAFGRWLDASIQKEVTNAGTLADVVVDGTVLIEGLPAPALLNLESKLAELRRAYAAIPTNDPAEQWRFDAQLGCYVSALRTTYKTKKTPRSHVAYEATSEHPAQVKIFNEDIRVGTWTTIVHSGGLAPAGKQHLLDRIDVLARAVKTARQRANSIDAEVIRVANVLFDYIHEE